MCSRTRRSDGVSSHILTCCTTNGQTKVCGKTCLCISSLNTSESGCQFRICLPIHFRFGIGSNGQSRFRNGQCTRLIGNGIVVNLAGTMSRNGIGTNILTRYACIGQVQSSKYSRFNITVSQTDQSRRIVRISISVCFGLIVHFHHKFCFGDGQGIRHVGNGVVTLRGSTCRSDGIGTDIFASFTTEGVRHHIAAESTVDCSRQGRIAFSINLCFGISRYRDGLRSYGQVTRLEGDVVTGSGHIVDAIVQNTEIRFIDVSR